MRPTFKPSRLLSIVQWLTYPFTLLLIYIGFLGAMLIVHYVYYWQKCRNWTGTDGHACAPCVGTDWFGAAILDNYAFIAILLYPLMIAYLQFTERLDADFRDMVAILTGRGVLQTIAEGSGRPRALRPARPEMARELDRIETWAADWSRLLAVVVTIVAAFVAVIGLAPLFKHAPPPWWYYMPLAVFHILLAFPVVSIAASRLGRVFCYGLAVLRHRRYGVEPQPIFEHSDGAGGLKPLGDYFLAQTYRMSLISGYLLLTTLFLLLSGELEPRMLNVDHHEVHLGLFRGISVLTVFVLLIQLLSLLLPFSTVHTRMVEFKRAHIGRAAVMTRRRQRLLALIEAEQRKGGDVAAQRALLDLVERWINSYEAFPAWPIPTQSLRNFWILWGGAILTALSMLISAITGGGSP